MKYFAADDPKVTVSTLLSRAEKWFNFLYRNGYLEKLEKSWRFYHGHYFNDTHSIGFSGDYGEYNSLAVNHYKNIADLMANMITSTRVTYKARASNSDSKSLIQAELANGLLDYYVRHKRVDKYVQAAVKQALILGAGYVKIEWNPTSGDIYDFHPETGSPLYEGDIEFSNLEPQDVIFDPNKGSNAQHEWVLTRKWVNRYNLIAKFPEFEEQILSLPTKNKYIQFKRDFDFFKDGESDDIAVYEFFHLKTESMPQGRYLLFLSEDIVLMDQALPYRRLPVFRIVPSEIMGTTFGYTPMFDLLPLQEALNSLYSTIFTNQITFGVQNIYVPRGADISLKSLEGGLNIIEGNSGLGKPEPINFTSTPAEIFQFVQILKKEMETISGINSVIRGDPEASLRSGSALALVQSMALQYISGFQAQYIFMLEDIGSAIIELLRDFAAIPRVALIAGEGNVTYVQREFTSDDLSSVDRVIVEIGNPLSATLAGKVQMATDLLQYGLVKTPEDYWTVINTGQFSAFTEDSQRQNNFVKKENELLLTGNIVPVLATDAHLYHIRKHKALLDDPERRNPTDPIVENILNHILEHVEALRKTDPGLLALLQEQPLAPANAAPPNPPVEGEVDVNQSMTPSTEPIEGEQDWNTIREESLPQPPNLPPETMFPDQNAEQLGMIRG